LWAQNGPSSMSPVLIAERPGSGCALWANTHWAIVGISQVTPIADFFVHRSCRHGPLDIGSTHLTPSAGCGVTAVHRFH
jgi:hypothetical protein